jgi:hypothetical protein
MRAHGARPCARIAEPSMKDICLNGGAGKAVREQTCDEALSLGSK